PRSSPSFPTRRSSDLLGITGRALVVGVGGWIALDVAATGLRSLAIVAAGGLVVYGASLAIAFRAGVWRTRQVQTRKGDGQAQLRSEEHTSELQSLAYL